MSLDEAKKAKRTKLLRRLPYCEEDVNDIEIDPQWDIDTQLEILKGRQEYQEKLEEKKLRKEQAAQGTDAKICAALEQMSLQEQNKDRPNFKGEPGEKPESHLLVVEDWKERNGYTDRDMPRHFRLTLTGQARIWYGEQEADLTWEEMKNEFVREFDKHGVDLRTLRRQYGSLQYDPDKDSMREFIRELKQMGRLLQESKESMFETLKFALPEHLFLIASNMDTDFDKLCQWLIKTTSSSKAKKEAEKRRAKPATASPFLSITDENGNLQPQYVVIYPESDDYAAEDERSPERNQPRNPTIHYVAMQGNKPYKPQVTIPGRGRTRQPLTPFRRRPQYHPRPPPRPRTQPW